MGSEMCIRDSLHTIAIFFALSLILASVSLIPLRFYLPRILFFIPLFTGIIALPYIFNVFQPYEGTPLVVLYDFRHLINIPLLRPFSRIEITREGVLWASIFLARVTTAVSFAILLMLSTRWSDLVGALEPSEISEGIHHDYEYDIPLYLLIT